MSERRRLMMQQKQKLWLYKDGDECVSVTGGWSFPNIGSGYEFDCTNGGATLTRTKNANDITLHMKVLRGTFIPIISVHTNNKINFSLLNKYTKLYIEGTCGGGAPWGSSTIGTYSVLPQGFNQNTNRLESKTIANFTQQVNFSKSYPIFIQDGYLTLYIAPYSEQYIYVADGVIMFLKITKIWLE